MAKSGVFERSPLITGVLLLLGLYQRRPNRRLDFKPGQTTAASRLEHAWASARQIDSVTVAKLEMR